MTAGASYKTFQTRNLCNVLMIKFTDYTCIINTCVFTTNMPKKIQQTPVKGKAEKQHSKATLLQHKIIHGKISKSCENDASKKLGAKEIVYVSIRHQHVMRDVVCTLITRHETFKRDYSLNHLFENTYKFSFLFSVLQKYYSNMLTA